MAEGVRQAKLLDGLVILTHEVEVQTKREVAARQERINFQSSVSLLISVTKLPAGKGREWRALWEKYTKPIFEKLYADGNVTGLGLDVEQIHTVDPQMRFEWHILSNADALDKVNAAFEAARSSPEER